MRGLYLHLARQQHSAAAAKPFDEMFSPKTLPIIGHDILFLPKIGKFSAERLTENLHSIMKDNGVSVMKLKLKGETTVFTISPEDTQTIFYSEGKNPLRSSMDTLSLIRERNGQSCGVIASNGEPWAHFRRGVNLLLKRPLVAAYHEKHKSMAKLHVFSIDEEVKRNGEQVLQDVLAHCTRFTVDAISLISPVMDVANEADKKKVVEQATILLDGLFKTMMAPPVIYKFIKTKTYRNLESANNYFHSKIEANLKSMDLSEEPFLKSLFTLDNMSYKNKVICAMDIFLGGIDATATTIAMTLHYLSLDMALQELILEEISSADANNYRLLKCCIKETLRMSAVGGGNSRFIQKEAVIGGYRVPKGVSVVSLNPVIGLLEEHFPSPHQYKPHRWLRDVKPKTNPTCSHLSQQGLNRAMDPKSVQENESVFKAHPFAALPFGFGPRMCPGKMIAEQEMVLFLAEVLRNFRLEAVDKKPLGMVFRMNRIPDRLINIRFVRR